MSEKVEVVKIDTAPAVTSLADLRRQLKAVKDEMAGMESGSDAFLKAANKAGELKHQLDEIQQATAGASADFGDLMGNIGKVGAGVTGAFQTATAALSLFGVESEEVTKSIKTMQNMMAITQGLTSIDAAIKSLNKLRNAITSTTVVAKALKIALQPKVFVAIAAAIGLVTYAFQKMRGSQEDAIKKQAEMEKSLTDSNVRLAKSYSNVNNAIAKMGTTSLPVLQAEYSRAEYQFSKVAKSRYGWTQKQVEQFRGYIKAYNEAIRSAANATTEEESRMAMSSANSWMSVIGALVKGKDDLFNWGNQMLSLDDQIYEAEHNVKKSVDDTNKSVEDRVAAINKYAGHIISQMSQLHEVSVIEEPETSGEEEFLDRLAKYYHDVEDIAKKAKEITGRTVEEEFAYEQELLDSAVRTKLITQEEYTLACEDLAKRRHDYEIQMEEDAAEQKRQLASSVVAVSAQSIGAISDLLGGLADLQDTTTKAGFEKQKKLSIASATLSMLQGIATALAGTFTTKSGPWDIALAAVQAASIAASTGVQIAKIKKQTFDSGSSTSTSANISSSAATSLIAPVQYTQEVSGGAIEGAIRDTKVYVTETDISNTQRRVSVAETENRY